MRTILSAGHDGSRGCRQNGASFHVLTPPKSQGVDGEYLASMQLDEFGELMEAVGIEDERHIVQLSDALTEWRKRGGIGAGGASGKGGELG